MNCGLFKCALTRVLRLNVRRRSSFSLQSSSGVQMSPVARNTAQLCANTVFLTLGCFFCSHISSCCNCNCLIQQPRLWCMCEPMWFSSFKNAWFKPWMTVELLFSFDVVYTWLHWFGPWCPSQSLQSLPLSYSCLIFPPPLIIFKPRGFCHSEIAIRVVFCTTRRVAESSWVDLDIPSLGVLLRCYLGSPHFSWAPATYLSTSVWYDSHAVSVLVSPPVQSRAVFLARSLAVRRGTTVSEKDNRVLSLRWCHLGHCALVSCIDLCFVFCFQMCQGLAARHRQLVFSW